MDTLRFAVEPVPESIDVGFEVQIFVNEVEMTRAGAGLGMDTNDLLLPDNEFRLADEPRHVAVARCDCGVYGCRWTDIMITADDDVVHWDWLGQQPMDRRVTFDRDAYLAEVERLETDRSWETPERVTVRLITKAAATLPLAEHGLRYSGASNFPLLPGMFTVSLYFDDEYQVYVVLPQNDSNPEQLAAEMLDLLARDPSTWDARWHAIKNATVPPAIAGENWSPLELPRFTRQAK